LDDFIVRVLDLFGEGFWLCASCRSAAGLRASHRRANRSRKTAATCAIRRPLPADAGSIGGKTACAKKLIS
jgi:hypothetical protein